MAGPAARTDREVSVVAEADLDGGPDTGDASAPDVDVTTERDPAAVRTRQVAAVLAVLTVLALAAAIVLGTQALSTHGRDADARAATAAARQVAVNLTTIRAESADADLQRLLDGATGDFRAEFEERRGPFVEIVQQASVSTSGEVVEAGVVDLAGDTARVLLAVRSQVDNAASPEAEERNYRLAMTLQRVDGAWLASAVEFVA